MGRSRINIALLSSSRADYGIYLPLLKSFRKDETINLSIVAFGTHLSESHGNTISEILNDGFDVSYRIKTTPAGDSPLEISKSIGETINLFSKFWDDHNSEFDLMVVLGDRYEMFAAVTAASTFNMDIAHIHAGETTLGAVDNAYRHSISLMSKYLFVTNNIYKKRAEEISEYNSRIFNVGALSLDNLRSQKLLSIKEFYNNYKVNLDVPTILSTFHPETVSIGKNEEYVKELVDAFNMLKNDYQIIVTLPNADTMSNLIRRELINFGSNSDNVFLFESLGMKGYLSCMKYSSMLIGNTSSGFVEASYFPKWVINLGDRQKGRIVTSNIINTRIKKNDIVKSVAIVEKASLPNKVDIYGDGNAASKITSIIKELYGS